MESRFELARKGRLNDDNEQHDEDHVHADKEVSPQSCRDIRLQGTELGQC